MKTKLLLQFGLFLTMLLITTSEGFFFEYPKKVLMDLIHSLKAKKKLNDFQHYHVHYHTVPYPVFEPQTKAPKKHELDQIHLDYLTALGWSNNEFKYVPKPKIHIPPSSFNSWETSIPWKHEILESDVLETVNHSEDDDILVQVPFGQKVIIEHPSSNEKSKKELLLNLYHKIKNLKSSIHK